MGYTFSRLRKKEATGLPRLTSKLPSIWCCVVLLHMLCCCIRETTCTLAKEFTAHIFKATSEEEVGIVTMLSNKKNNNSNYNNVNSLIAFSHPRSEDMPHYESSFSKQICCPLSRLCLQASVSYVHEVTLSIHAVPGLALFLFLGKVPSVIPFSRDLSSPFMM